MQQNNEKKIEKWFVKMSVAIMGKYINTQQVTRIYSFGMPLSLYRHIYLYNKKNIDTWCVIHIVKQHFT